MNEEQEKNTEIAEKPGEIAGRVETFTRRLFERIGGALDFALRRPMNPQPRTDVTTLIPQIERVIEEKLRREGSRVLAPNLIELSYDYETYSQMTRPRADFLEKELRATVYEYIHNRRYGTVGDVRVKVGFNVFSRGLVIKAQFPDEQQTSETSSAAESSAEVSDKTAAEPVLEYAAEIVLRSTDRRISDRRVILSAAQSTASVGRSRDNAIVLDETTVSSFHGTFSLSSNGTLLLSDLGSSNGSFVNGVRLSAGERAVVRQGDKIQFGELQMKLEIRITNS
jgi:hypothetical protein